MLKVLQESAYITQRSDERSYFLVVFESVLNKCTFVLFQNFPTVFTSEVTNFRVIADTIFSLPQLPHHKFFVFVHVVSCRDVYNSSHGYKRRRKKKQEMLSLASVKRHYSFHLIRFKCWVFAFIGFV